MEIDHKHAYLLEAVGCETALMFTQTRLKQKREHKKLRAHIQETRRLQKLHFILFKCLPTK